jgi:hypothetical protein
MAKTENLEKPSSNHFLNIQIEELKGKIELELKRIDKSLANMQKTATKILSGDASSVLAAGMQMGMLGSGKTPKQSYLTRPKKQKMCQNALAK